MYLWYEIRIIRRLLSTQSKSQSFFYICKFIITIDIVFVAGWTLWFILSKITLISISYRRFSFWELTLICIKCDRTLRIIIFESSCLWEAKRKFRWRIISKMLLDILMRNQWDFAHTINFITNTINIVYYR